VNSRPPEPGSAWSQTGLARALGLSRSAIAWYETHDLRIPKVVALAVAHLLATRKSA
jgi:transcriptional regulator with XRE-family HTH domain